MGKEGLVLGCSGGLYEILTAGGRIYSKAAGRFRHARLRLLPGDRVSLRDTEGENFVEEILPRQNVLIRPSMANLTRLYLIGASVNPETNPLNFDKLLSICEYNRIEPVIVITKSDQSHEQAEALGLLYRSAGFPVFETSAESGEGISALRAEILSFGGIAAFAGASGAGKSTLLNALFPGLSLQTGALSEKIARGKNTTRAVTLYPIRELEPTAADGYLADTPGFTMLDFEQFDFFPPEALPGTFREFSPFLGKCRYTDCRHTGDEGCEIGKAVEEGKIMRSRYESYCALYADLKDKKSWEK